MLNGQQGDARSRVCLYADDTIVYLTIKPQAQRLRKDLNNIELLKNGLRNLTLTSS